MPTSERVRDSCYQNMDVRFRNTPRVYKIIGLVFTILLFIAMIVCIDRAVSYSHAAKKSLNGAAVKARIPGDTTVVYETITSTMANLFSPLPVHTSSIVCRGFNSGAIAGICVAVTCGVLLILILLTYVARSLVHRFDWMNSAGDHHAGNCCGGIHSVRALSVTENVEAGYSLRDLSVGGKVAGEDLAADALTGNRSAGNPVAEDDALKEHVARHQTSGKLPAGDQSAGNDPLEK